MSIPKRFMVKTLGCKANLADSLELSSALKRHGWVEVGAGDTEAPGLCVVNSCTVTDEADRQSRKLASRLSRLHPEARVVVTGCAAEIDPERVARSPGIHYVIGNRDKPRLAELILEKLGQPISSSPQAELVGRTEGYREIASRHPMDREWPILEGEESLGEAKTRGFLKIQEGCNSFCTYCIIPYGRGPARSLRPIEILTQIRRACSQGVRELVLTGTNLGDYGTDLSEKPMFEDLLRMILDETPLERLRLSSLDPTEVTPGIFELMGRDPRLCPHFHISLQSASDRILKLMKRKYGTREAEACLNQIASLPGLGVSRPFVGMDVITGFPGETEREFEEGYARLERWPWMRLHVFPYSEREGTPATRLPESVMREERVRRSRRLAELSLTRLQSHYEEVLRELKGQPLEGVLLEKEQSIRTLFVGTSGEDLPALSGEWRAGYSPAYLRVLAPSSVGLRNELCSVTPRVVAVHPASGEVSFLA